MAAPFQTIEDVLLNQMIGAVTHSVAPVWVVQNEGVEIDLTPGSIIPLPMESVHHLYPSKDAVTYYDNLKEMLDLVSNGERLNGEWDAESLMTSLGIEGSTVPEESAGMDRNSLDSPYYYRA